jgi:response regulator NasT
MEDTRFILCGKDKKTLLSVKNSLTSEGFLFIGYTSDTNSILQHVRKCKPNMIIVEVNMNRFQQLKSMLEVIDEEVLAVCILVLEFKNSEIVDFVKKSKLMYYLSKPVFGEALVQITQSALMNLNRVLEYEKKIQKLNQTLENRKIVEKAKWLLVEKNGFSEAEAHDVIRKKSRDNRVTMREIAEAIILTET